MDDKLLSYYNRELSYLRKMGKEFSEKHPKIAGRIRLDQNSIEDPHVSRLIESFAFITSRIRRTIDDSFPELTESLMGLLYPDYHAPIPSMSIAHIQSHPSLLDTSHIKKGSDLSIKASNGKLCRYRTCYPTTILPVAVRDVAMSSFPVKAPLLPKDIQSNGSSHGLLKISLGVLDKEASFQDITETNIDFYINDQPQVAYKLYEYLLNNVTGIAIAPSPSDANPIFLPSSKLKASGFDEDKTVIPFDGRTSAGHRLLAEYFTFPEKFLFVNLQGIEEAWQRFPDGFNIYIYLNIADGDLVHGITKDTLKTGCTPIVNLSKNTCQGIAGNLIDHENKLVVNDVSTSTDVHTITDVYALSGKNERIAIHPFYGSGLKRDSKLGVYWHIRRENSHWKDGNVSYGTDTYISFVDENFQEVAISEHWLVMVEALCNNRDIPNKLPFGPDKPEVQFVEGSTLPIKCITPPTPTLQPELSDATRWQLVTQLSLQNFAAEDGLTVLKDTLKLYDFQDNHESKAIIDGICSFSTKITSARVLQEGRAAICRGTHIIVEFDEDFYSGSGLFLFGAVLNDFFAHFCTINSFIKMEMRVKQRPNYRHIWPPQNGKQVLL